MKQQCHAHLLEGQKGSCELSLSPWKGYGLFSPQCQFQPHEGQEVFGNCQDGLPRSKSRLTNKVAFHKEMTALDNGRRVEVIFLLDFTESFSVDFHSIFVARIERCGHDCWTTGLEDHCPQSTVEIKLRTDYKCHSSSFNTGVNTDQCLL